MGRFVKKIKNKQYGQAMAEFALTIPIFLLLVFGVIELSRFFLVYSSVYTASREASRFGSSVGETSNKNFLNCQSIAERAVEMGWFGGVQLGDLTISYESTPGTIVANCPNFNSGSVPLKVGCTSGNCEYKPELGHRILVDIVTEFDSLLGIIPSLPVHASNGRTIMMELSAYSPPIDRPLCGEIVAFNGAITQSDDYTLTIIVENDSTITHYIIYEIKDLEWITTNDLPLLQEIRWDNNPIWINPGDSLPPINILSHEWDSVFNRNLPAKQEESDPVISVPLSFVFSEEIILSDINFDFDLIVINASFYEDICDPVD